MTFVDASVLVAAFGRWHERHDDARLAVQRADRVAAHAVLETYAVLTAMPPPRRAPGGLVLSFLAAHFPDDEPSNAGPRSGDPPIACLVPEAETYRLVLSAVEEHGLIGGAVYDGLVAATAKQAGATLVTLDQRATEAYRAVGAPFEVL